jgi:hypothetical protein
MLLKFRLKFLGFSQCESLQFFSSLHWLISCWISSYQYARVIEYHKQIEEEFEDTKEVIRIRKSKNRQHNGQKKKDKWTNNLQNTT